MLKLIHDNNSKKVVIYLETIVHIAILIIFVAFNISK